MSTIDQMQKALEHCEELLMRYSIDRIDGEEIADAALTIIREALRPEIKQPTEPGWICSNQEYGTWFISRYLVIKDWQRDQLEYYGREATEIDGDEIETWFNEQISWVEVAHYGIQLKRPDMIAIEKSFYDVMKRDTDWIDDAIKVG